MLAKFTVRKIPSVRTSCISYGFRDHFLFQWTWRKFRSRNYHIRLGKCVYYRH